MRKIITLLFISATLYAGLQRTENLDTGITADYYDISSFIVDYNSDVMEIYVQLYKDKAAKDAGAKPIKNKVIRINVPQKLIDAKADLFTKLKTLPEFQGAIDQ